MCGIAGILRVHPPGSPPPPPELAIPESWLDILDESIKHRGPDGQGRFRDRAVRADGSVVDVAFVHRRLSILDHAGGAQPMVSLRGRSALRADSSLGPSVPGPDSSPSSSRHTLGTVHLDLGSPRVGSESRPTNGPTKIFHGKPNDEVRYRPLDSNTTAGLVAVVFNGCIYNHRELRKELQAAGHVFESDHSDTEVLVHGWREWKTELADHLDGMYAFAIWDRNEGELVLGSDLAQEKPLYYNDRSVRLNARWVRHSFAFGSSPAGLSRFRAGGMSGKLGISHDWIGNWVRFGSCSDPAESQTHRWTYRAMAHRMCELDTKPTRASELPSRETPQPLTVTTVDQLLARAVESRLESDVELGCFLSGGVDSSIVAYHARRARGQLRTFCVTMPDVRYDESIHAARVAKLIGTDHATLPCEARPAEDLVKLIESLGLPLGDSSLLPTAWLCKAARQVTRVALSGDGGDELFCGYRRHAITRFMRRYGSLIALVPAGVIPERSPRSVLRRMVQSAREGYLELLAIFSLSDMARLTMGMENMEFAWEQSFPFDGKLDPAAYDFWNYLADDILCKTDTASMAVGLEVRAPFLARSVVEACLRAPYSDLMPHNQRKGLLRAVARKYFPAEIVDRPKQGFAIPIGEWFRSDYGGMRQLLLDHLNSAEPWGSPSLGIDLNMKFVRQMLKEHDEAGTNSLWPWKGRDHSQRLYMLLVLSIWAKWLSKLS